MVFPLHEALLSNDADEVKRLIKSGVDVDEERSGFSALYSVVSSLHHGALAYAQLLLREGADPNKMQGKTLAVRTTLGLAVGHDLTDIVDLLLKYGADVNSAYALHISSIRCKTAITRMLITYGGDVKLTDPSGELPIDVLESYLAFLQNSGNPPIDEEIVLEMRQLLAV